MPKYGVDAGEGPGGAAPGMGLLPGSADGPGSTSGVVPVELGCGVPPAHTGGGGDVGSPPDPAAGMLAADVGATAQPGSGVVPVPAAPGVGDATPSARPKVALIQRIIANLTPGQTESGNGNGKSNQSSVGHQTPLAPTRVTRSATK